MDGKGRQVRQDFPKNWVVFRLSALGDVILTTGVLRHWHESCKWRFRVITKEPFIPVFENNPYVDSVIAATQENLRMPRMNEWFAELAKHYKNDGLLDLHGTLRSRLLSMHWKGPVLRYPKHSLARRAFLLSGGTLYKEKLNMANVSERYAAAFTCVSGIDIPKRESLVPQVYLTDRESEWGKSFLANLFSDDVLKSSPGCVALHPFASHRHKAWPKQSFVALCKSLDTRGIPWFFFGQGDALFPGEARDLTGKTTLRESAALLAASTVLVSGDSGPVHLASAVGTPVVALFGPTTREWGFFPSGPQDVVLEKDLECRPCSLHGKKECPDSGQCLASISPEEVMAAVDGILTGNV